MKRALASLQAGQQFEAQGQFHAAEMCYRHAAWLWSDERRLIRPEDETPLATAHRGLVRAYCGRKDQAASAKNATADGGVTPV